MELVKIKSNAMVQFNRVTNKFDVVKDSITIAWYSGYSDAKYRADYENGV